MLFRSKSYSGKTGHKEYCIDCKEHKTACNTDIKWCVHCSIPKPIKDFPHKYAVCDICCKEYIKSMKLTDKPNHHYHSYKTRAKNHNIIFELSFDDFVKFWQKPCWYCGKNIERVGVDRVSNGSYKIGELVPACIDCNRFKSNFLRDEIEWRSKLIIEKGMDLATKISN